MHEASLMLADSFISIHAPPRGATKVQKNCGRHSSLFQFTPLREGRRPLQRCQVRLPAISIHAPPRGATKSSAALSPIKTFQFTPLREGRPYHARKAALLTISIHAPPRGATDIVMTRYEKPKISIHAPPRGATRCFALGCWRYSFQFTPLREGRPPTLGVNWWELIISIHAPPRGATASDESAVRRTRFQFTPLREGRQQKICNFCKSFVQPLQISMA